MYEHYQHKRVMIDATLHWTENEQYEEDGKQLVRPRVQDQRRQVLFQLGHTDDVIKRQLQHVKDEMKRFRSEGGVIHAVTVQRESWEDVEQLGVNYDQ